MPTPAQERIGRGPFGALLILLSLLVGSGGAVASSGDIRHSERLGPSRQSASAALLPSATRSAVEEEPCTAGGDPAASPSGPQVVTKRLRARPEAVPSRGHQAALSKTTGPSHRARAPPAA